MKPISVVILACAMISIGTVMIMMQVGSFLSSTFQQRVQFSVQGNTFTSTELDESCVIDCNAPLKSSFDTSIRSSLDRTDSNFLDNMFPASEGETMHSAHARRRPARNPHQVLTSLRYIQFHLRSIAL